MSAVTNILNDLFVVRIQSLITYTDAHISIEPCKKWYINRFILNRIRFTWMTKDQVRLPSFESPPVRISTSKIHIIRSMCVDLLIEFLIILSICLCITFNFSYDFVLLNGPHSFRLLPLCLELVTVISSLFFTNSEQFYFCTEFPYEIMNYLVFFPDGCVFVYTLIIFPIANFKLL